MRFVRRFGPSFLLAALCMAQDLAIRQATVYPAPGAEPVPHSTVLIHGGKIAAVGQRVSVPPGTRTMDCPGCLITAGFWNAHVHFTEQKWFPAGTIASGQLTLELERMLTHSGFSTVVDTASDPANTTTLRRRIESGEVPGPRIFTAGFGLYPPNGIPYYLSDLPPEIRKNLPQPATPEAAAAVVRRMHDMGADLTKLFTGSWVQPGHVLPMPVAIASAAAKQAHQFHQLVFAHPSNLAGIRVAIEAGVDVLAHAPDETEGVDDTVIDQLLAHHMAMIPTLKLFSGDSSIAQIRSIVTAFHAKGGQLIFGTDTGFLTDYDLREEYRQLAACGLQFRDVLAMLTTNPVERFGLAKTEGQVRPGFRGDLTVLMPDDNTRLAPGDNTQLDAFSHIRYVIRNGRVIFDSAVISKGVME